MNILSISGAMLGAVSQGILWGVMALGVYITFKILDFADMTVDSSFTLGGCVCAVLIVSGINPLLAILVATLFGAVAGFVTGIIHTKLKIPGILAGILVQLGLYSINVRIVGGAQKPLKPINDTVITFIENILNLKAIFGRNAKSMSALIAGVIFIAVLIIILYWFFGTELGSAIRATGDNERMSRAQGINTDNMKIIALMISNGLVAMSGALVMQQQRVADVGMGIGAIVIGLASIIIGEVIFGKRIAFWFYLLGVVLGSIIYRIIIAFVLQLGLNPSDLKLLSALIVTLALSIPVIKKNVAGSKRRA
ncbi:MAG: ABC transporter permease [Treponema sp.]|nr:ABC transporter permease [Treponema sp.]